MAERRSDGAVDGTRPLVRAGLRAFLDLERLDVLLVIGLTLLALAVRIGSPLVLDFPGQPGGGTPIAVLGLGYPYSQDPHACADVPVGPHGAEEHHCGFVFDEIYFPVGAAKDLRQPPQSYFDDKPPLTKLLIAPPIAFWGFHPWSWRLSSAIAGSLMVGVMYLIARRLRRDRFFAVAASLFVGFDGLALVESRTGVIDMIAVLFVGLFYYGFLLHWQARTRTQWRCTAYALATLGGLAFATKLTALAPVAVATALIAVRVAEPLLVKWVPAARALRGPRAEEGELWRRAAGRWGLAHYAAGLVIVGAVYVASFARYDTISHPDVYMFHDCTPKGGPIANVVTLPPATMRVAGHTVPDVAQAVRNAVINTQAGLSYGEQECRDHPYASRWYTWPVMEHPVLFFAASNVTTAAGEPAYADITNMGNPAVWWPAIPALLACAWRMTRGPLRWRLGVSALGIAALATMIVSFHAAERADTVRVSPGPVFAAGFAGVGLFCLAAAVSAAISRRFVPALAVLGYVTAWMMWVPGNERRILFFYHALGMLPFAAIGLAYVLALLRSGRKRLLGWEFSAAPLAWGGLAVVLAAFVFFYPVWTGIPLSNADHALRVWVDTP